MAMFSAYLILAVLLIGTVAFPHSAHAGVLNTTGKAVSKIAGGAIGVFGSVTSGFVATLAFLVVYDLAVVVGVIVALEAWLIGIILNISDATFQTVFVQSGFSIALSIANLAFVLGIIVIAIATIIRNENYGIKKLLWKLVVAAVLVNFGLVIAAPIFGLANSFSHYFVNCINPAGGGCTQSFNGFQSWDNFATTFAGAFQPENTFTFITGNGQQGTNVLSGQGLKTLTGAFSPTTPSSGKMLVALLGVLFGAFNLLLIVLVLLGFLILLLVRYIYISILAILMPFAWASWVFPVFGDHWKKWWDKFLQWTFFAPIALFFIYLAMLLMQTGNGATAVGGTNWTQQYQTGGIFTALQGFFGVGTGLSNILPAVLQEIVFVGLIIGGLFAANSMGLKGAKAVTGAVTAGSKAGGTWMAKKYGRGMLNAASSTVRPRTSTDREGNIEPPRTRLQVLRTKLADTLQAGAESKVLSTDKGLMETVYESAKKGSGLIKKKKGSGGGHGDDGGGGGHGGGGGGGGGRGGRGHGGGGGGGGETNATSQSSAGSGQGGGHGAHGEDTTAAQMTSPEPTDAVAAANEELDRQGFGGGSNTKEKEETPLERAQRVLGGNGPQQKEVDSSSELGNNIPKPPTPPAGNNSNVIEMPKAA